MSNAPVTVRRKYSIAKRVALSGTALLVACAIFEMGVRFYYWFGAVPLAISYNAPDEAWKAEWIMRHVRTNVEVTYGYDEYDERLGWRLRPNLRQFRFGGQPPVTSNSNGLRDSREIPYNKPAGTHRIVVLGDSFTFGQNVEQENVWPVHLELLLSGWEVLNLAVHGYGTDQQLLMFQYEGARYKPDIVLLGFFVENAFRNVLAFRDYAKPLFVLRDGKLELTNVPVPSPHEILADARAEPPSSYALHWMRRRWIGRYGSNPSVESVSSETALRVTRALLEKFHKDVEDRQARLLVVVIPFDGFPPSEMVEKTVLECAANTGFPLINLRDALSRAEAETGEPMYDAHFTPAGHAATAAAVRKELVRLGWVE